MYPPNHLFLWPKPSSPKNVLLSCLTQTLNIFHWTLEKEKIQPDVSNIDPHSSLSLKMTVRKRLL